MVNAQYLKGYNAGLAMGRRKAGEAVIGNDLKFVYGMMCIELFNRGWTTEELEDLCVSIQEDWVREADEDERIAREGGTPEKMVDKVYRITGVQLVQKLTVAEDEN